MTKVVELVFIPSPGLSHLISTVEAAKLLLARGNNHLAITVLVIKVPKERDPGDDQKNKMSSILKETPHLRFIDLPNDHDVPADSKTFIFDYIDSHIEKIRKAVSDLIEQPSVADFHLAGLVLDMFCTKFIQVAEEFNIPSYVFFTSGACGLGLSSDLVSLKFEHNQDLTQYKNSDTELSIRCFSKPVPATVLPISFVDDGPIASLILEYFRRIAESNGILINTFYELEQYTIESLSTRYNLPKVYPIGPILESNRDSNNQSGNELMNWLDHQPENSVVFLCFGTMGALDEIQVKEFAKALEDSGSRFLWSLRKRNSKGASELPDEYDNFEEILPAGFLERTAGIGKVIGWAPQVAVLAHTAVGGFVSHCGWNSTLESVWHGVPMAALPMYAEQQINAFVLVRELGIAEEIKIDYTMDVGWETPGELVPAGKIEAAIRRVMAAEGNEVRRKMKEMQNKSREAVEEGGSSYRSQIEFVQDVIKNVDGILG